VFSRSSVSRAGCGRLKSTKIPYFQTSARIGPSRALTNCSLSPQLHCLTKFDLYRHRISARCTFKGARQFSIGARLRCVRFSKRALAGRSCLGIKCDFNYIRVRSFVLTGAPCNTARQNLSAGNLLGPLYPPKSGRLVGHSRLKPNEPVEGFSFVKDDPPGGGVPFLRDQKVNSPIKIYFFWNFAPGFHPFDY
jgi:hypothetical protein